MADASDRQALKDRPRLSRPVNDDLGRVVGTGDQFVNAVQNQRPPIGGVMSIR